VRQLGRRLAGASCTLCDGRWASGASQASFMQQPAGVVSSYMASLLIVRLRLLAALLGLKPSLHTASLSLVCLCGFSLSTARQRLHACAQLRPGAKCGHGGSCRHLPTALRLDRASIPDRCSSERTHETRAHRSSVAPRSRSAIRKKFFGRMRTCSARRERLPVSRSVLWRSPCPVAKVLGTSGLASGLPPRANASARTGSPVQAPTKLNGQPDQPSNGREDADAIKVR
jgi:hypothetical protein